MERVNHQLENYRIGEGYSSVETLAVIADIHSNVFALEAILENVRLRKIKEIVNLGDIFYGPVAPKETYNVVKRNSWITILGNQDRYLFESTSEDIKSNQTLEFVLAELGEEAIEWLKSCQTSQVIDDQIFACHGTPANDTTYLLETVTSGFPILRSDEDIQAELVEIDQQAILCAHTHIPRTIRLSDGKLVLNPGSVGMPAYSDDAPCFHKMETGSPHARYAILSKANGQWLTEHIQVPYDFETAAKAAKCNGRMDWGNLLKSGRS